MMTSEMFEGLQPTPTQTNTISIKSSPIIEINNNGITINGEIHYEPYRPYDLDMTPTSFVPVSPNIKYEGIGGYFIPNCFGNNIAKEFGYIKEEEIKKEGINMELLNIYKEKSLHNINKYYEELRDKEYNKNEAVKAVNELTEKFKENVNKLIEKYGEDVIVYDECYFEDSIMADIDDTEEITHLYEKEKECTDEFNEKIKEINAHLQLENYQNIRMQRIS